jgi:hypothetical protein
MSVRLGRLGAVIVLASLGASMLPGCGRSSASKQGAEASVGGTEQGGEAGIADGGSGGSYTAVAGSSATGGGGELGSVGGAGVEVCVPGERSCDGSSIRVCGADGTSVIEKTCSPSEVCSEAKCRPIVCVPNTNFCEANIVRSCDEDGTRSKAFEECSANEFCVQNDGSADCSPTACTPSGPTCVGNVATRCRADGAGTQAGGQDCTKTEQVCHAGKCVAATCVAGEKRCEGGNVQLCLGDGVGSVLFTDCQADETCDPNLLACRKVLCEPGKLGCDSTRIVTCNALGTGWDQSGTDCGTSNQVCAAGSCKQQVCVPSSTFCQNGDIYQCDALGVASSFSQSCSPSTYYHCAPYPYQANTATCAYNACSPGAATCVGNVSTKCAEDGSGGLAGGTDCAPDGICDTYTGLCKTKVCVPYSYYCTGNDVMYCQDGLSSYTSSFCPSDTLCKVTAGSPACVPYACSPGLKSCIANQVGTCAADGMALSLVKQDCAATDEVCTSETACGPSATDTVGAAEELSVVGDGQVFGDVIDVQSNRKLTQLEANIVLAGSRNLRWVVYELVDGYFVSRYEAVVLNQSGAGYFSSGAISYTLKAGKRYLLAVAVTGGGLAPYYDALPWQPEVSFGLVKGGVSSSYSTYLYGYLSNSLVYDIRVTTQLP